MGRCTRVHWESLQCNVHSFVGYWREEGMLRHQSYCCIFDGTKHNNRDGSCLLKELTCSRELQGSSHTEENPLPISATAVQASKKNKYKFVGKLRYVLMTILTERPVSRTFCYTSRQEYEWWIKRGAKRAAESGKLYQPKNKDILTAEEWIYFCVFDRQVY